MDAHTKQFLFFAAVWFATGLLNLALTKRTPEQWEAYLLEKPRAAFVVKALRHIGFDLPGLIRTAQSYLGAKALSEGKVSK